MSLASSVLFMSSQPKFHFNIMFLLGVLFANWVGGGAYLFQFVTHVMGHSNCLWS